MEDAATVDLRGDKVLPWMLNVIGRPRDHTLRDAIDELRRWRRGGAHRIDRDGDRVYEDSEAIRIMDAWWPLWIDAQFRRPLGARLWKALLGMIDYGIDNSPNNEGDHLGSAYDGSLYGHVQKDLRMVLGRKVKGRFSRIYCGSGRRRHSRRRKLRECRRLARVTLAQALRKTPAQLYEDETCESQPLGPADPGRVAHSQWCFDSIFHTAASAINQPVIHWVNRPTWQQAVEIERPAPR